MKTIKTQMKWEAVEKALAAGAFANHVHWHTNSPQAEPDYNGPTALGIHGGCFVVVTDNGVVIHDWRPSPAEMASDDWQIVEIAAGELKAAAARARQTAPMSPIINHDQNDPRSPIPVAGPQSRPDRKSRG